VIQKFLGSNAQERGTANQTRDPNDVTYRRDRPKFLRRVARRELVKLIGGALKSRKGRAGLRVQGRTGNDANQPYTCDYATGN
jgi:hypothetical protein